MPVCPTTVSSLRQRLCLSLRCSHLRVPRPQQVLNECWDIYLTSGWCLALLMTEHEENKNNNNFWLITCFPIHYLIGAYETVETGTVSSIL